MEKIVNLKGKDIHLGPLVSHIGTHQGIPLKAPAYEDRQHPFEPRSLEAMLCIGVPAATILFWTLVAIFYPQDNNRKNK